MINNQPLFNSCDEPTSHITYENGCYKIYDSNSDKTFFALTADDAHFLYSHLQALSPENIAQAAKNLDNAMHNLYDKHAVEYVYPGTDHLTTIIRRALKLFVSPEDLTSQQTFLPEQR